MMNVETGKGAKQNIQGENIFGAPFFLVYWILYTIEIQLVYRNQIRSSSL